MTEPHSMEHIHPCPHMKNFLSALIDGNLTGLIHRYALWHVANCPKCQAALAALTQMSERLRALGTAPQAALAASEGSALSVDRWAAIEKSWDEADRTA